VLVDDRRAAILAAEQRGELLLAFDLAEQALAEQPDDRWLQHRAVLALARAGSTDEAERRFREYGLEQVEDEEAWTLAARLKKDKALASSGEERRRLAAEAAAAYRATFARTGGYYPAVNAATLELVAGNDEDAEAHARTALKLAQAADDHPYYAAATEAEALLLLGELDAARTALEQAARLAGGDHSAIATTRRQLKVVCAEKAIDTALLEALVNPEVVHFTGHRPPDGGWDPQVEATLSEQIRALVAARRIGFAFGSIAAGADILWAEALLAAGAELHLVFPFTSDEFVTTSVASSGPGWVERFRLCVEQAADVRFATEDAYLGDDILYRYAAELAMGLAILRARHLDSAVEQLALWDGRAARGEGGTAIDVARWREIGLPAAIVSSPAQPNADGKPVATGSSKREVRALLFGDIKGFSGLSDAQVPAFAERVLGAFAGVLEDHADAVGYQNTWGDGLYVVLRDAAVAAEVALALHAALADVDTESAGLPRLALRVGAHLGPVYPIFDPVLSTRAFMGSHVSRTARIEPVAPPGDVYVTEQFAAALALESAGFECRYVGHVPAAKDYGRLRMYRLGRLARSG
jgi:class 3 adenylate cyclase